MGVSVPTCGFIVQVTEVSLLPVTVAVNVWDCPAGRLEPGLTETETAAGGGAAPLDTISIASIFAAPITGLRRMIICPVLTETAALISTAVLAPPALAKISKFEAAVWPFTDILNVRCPAPVA